MKKAKEYIDVLTRQSARLKKLIEDLVEASKASTGNIPVVLGRTSINELLEQAEAEYFEKLNAGGLALIKEIEENLEINADSRLIWRVFDNLLGNACKYSLGGTRIYLTAFKQNDFVTVEIKNISKLPLNITTDELLERFVRGDSSRSTEGSGLGLSIAKSLTELQGGEMELKVDGDLFKVALKFKAFNS